MPNPRKRVLKDIRLDEISAVDKPAQEGAVATIMKRAPVDDEEQPSIPSPSAHETELRKYGDKVAVLTTVVDKHQHGIAVHKDYDGNVRYDMTYAKSSDEDDYGHTHPFTMDAEGNIEVGTVADHNHTVDGTKLMAAVANLISKGADMADNNAGSESSAATDAKIADLQKRAERAEAVVALDASRREHFDSLSKAEQTEFLDLSVIEQNKQVVDFAKRAEEADPVEYTMEDGTELRKSAGAVTIKLAKQADATAKENAELRKASDHAKFEKRAKEELEHLPGSVETHVAILKAVEGIEDEDTRKSAVETIKAHSVAFSAADETLGTTAAPPAEGSADSKLDAMAKAHAKENNMTFAKAYSKIIITPEGRELYGQTLN